MKRISSFKKLFAILLVIILIASSFSSAVFVNADTYYNGNNAKAWSQRTSPWNAYTYNTKTIGYTGCGILSCVNSINFMHGVFNDSTKVAAAVKEFADYAFSIGAFNPSTSGGGTYRYILFGTDKASVPPMVTKFGEKYNFTMPIYWQENWNYANSYDGGSYNNIYVNTKTALKEYLTGDAVAIAHVPGHFITLADYDPATKCFLVLDSASSAARGTTGANDGVAWVHEDLLSGGRPSLTVGGYCVLQSTASIKKNSYQIDGANYMISDCDEGIDYVASSDFHTNASISTSTKSQGESALKITPTVYTEQYADVAAMAFIELDESQNITTYDKIYYDLYLSEKISTDGTFQINFVTDSAAHDGYNANVDITTLNKGWNTIKIDRDTFEKAAATADWSNINRLRFTWFNTGGATSGYFIVDNIRATRKSVTVADFNEISNVSTLSSYGTTISASTGKTEDENSLKMVPQNYTGTNANVASMAFVDFASPLALDGFKEIRFEVYVSEEITVDGRFQINFITGSSSVWDGYNFDIQVTDLKQGWNTVVLDASNPTDTISSADWSTINRLRFTWFNEGGATSGYFMVSDVRMYVDTQEDETESGSESDSEPESKPEVENPVPSTNVCGDANLSGKTDATDALIILQYTVDKVTLTDKQLLAADVTTPIDGVVTVTDALIILQYSVDKIASLPV
ncbi:MAG: dockerin type I repeat-containing protein [Clostridia bacterium]|nr:dockerin type I repeat-containing protein [Clostridia bacterium]